MPSDEIFRMHGRPTIGAIVGLIKGKEYKVLRDVKCAAGHFFVTAKTQNGGFSQ